MSPRFRPTLSAIPRVSFAVFLATVAFLCFTIAAFGVDWRIGMVVAGLVLLVTEWRISD